MVFDWNNPDSLPQGWPYVPDPEIEKFKYEESEEDKELDKPITTDDPRIDKTRPDITDWFNMPVPPPTLRSIQEGQRVLNDTWIDDDPKNAWVYEPPPGPHIAVVTKKEWGGLPAKKRTPLKLPVQHIRFTHTEEPKEDSEDLKFPVCLEFMQNHQKKKMNEEGLTDIPYNFLIASDGYIYEGRGFYEDVERQPEFAHLKGNCLDVAYIGDFKDKNLPWNMVERGLELISYCIEAKILSPNFLVVPFKKIE